MKSILLTKNSGLDTFGRLPLTPYALSAFTIVKDEMRKTLQYAFVQAITK